MSLEWNLIFILFSSATLAVSFFKDRKKTRKALAVSGRSFLNMAPFFVAVFVLIGILEVFVPSSAIAALMGVNRGFIAVLFAAVAGGIMAGPPPASYPMADYLVKHNASLAAAATFIIAWVAVSTVSLPVEIRMMGSRFAWIRWSLTIVLSVIIGVILGWFM